MLVHLPRKKKKSILKNIFNVTGLLADTSTSIISPTNNSTGLNTSTSPSNVIQSSTSGSSLIYPSTGSTVTDKITDTVSDINTITESKIDGVISKIDGADSVIQDTKSPDNVFVQPTGGDTIQTNGIDEFGEFQTTETPTIDNGDVNVDVINNEGYPSETGIGSGTSGIGGGGGTSDGGVVEEVKEDKKISWWWIIVLGTFGYLTYRYYTKK